MDSLSDDALELILKRCTLEEQLVTFRLINSRFYRLLPMVRFRKLIVNDLIRLGPKMKYYQPINGTETTDAWMAEFHGCVHGFLEYFAGFYSHKIRTIELTKETTSEELLYCLANLFPHVTELNLNWKGGDDWALEQPLQNTIFEFRSLDTLRINQAGRWLAPLLTSLPLRRLEIGGSDAPILAFGNQDLQELTLSNPLPTDYSLDKAYRMGDFFPNLKVHKLVNQFGTPRPTPPSFERDGGFASYRRLKQLRRSDIIDFYFDRFLQDPISDTFPHLRRISLLQPRSFNPTSRQLEPALTAFLRLTDLSFRLTPTNGYFFRTVLASNSILKSLTIELPYESGSHLFSDLTKETMPFRFNLRQLSIKGVDPTPLLAKFWYACPNLVRLDFEDELMVRQAFFEDFQREKINFESGPRLQSLFLRSEVAVRLVQVFEDGGRLKKLRYFNTNICKDVTELDAIEMTTMATRLLTADRLPCLRRLAVSFKSLGPRSQPLAIHFLDSFPRLQELVYEFLLNHADQIEKIWARLGQHKALERFDMGLVGGGYRMLNSWEGFCDSVIDPRVKRATVDGYVSPWLSITLRGILHALPAGPNSDAKISVCIMRVC